MEKENKKKYRGSLRLDWVNKDLSLYYEIDEKEGKGVRPVWVPKNDIRVAEPRILKFEKSYGDVESENMLIKGDNLLVLRSLVEMFKGKSEKNKVKCIYIDPPYNTEQAFEHYDDNLEHSEWLTMMRDRLRELKKLLSKDGAIFVQIDHQEMAYLKVIMDEIFGRANYITTIPIQMRHPDRILVADKDVHDIVEYILFYAKSKLDFKIKKNLRDTTDYSQYKFSVIEKTQGKKIVFGDKEVIIFNPNEYEIITETPSKKLFKKENIRKSFIDRNSTGRFYKKYLMNRLKSDGYGVLYKVPNMGADDFGYRYILQPNSAKYTNANYFQGWPINKKEAEEIPLAAFIDVSEIMASADLSKEGGVRFPKSKKTEYIIDKILDWASVKDNDLVLDSFAGSGTTGAVAHKRNCRWIMIELGEHAEKINLERMLNVVNGEDQFGITELYDWHGGGGFKYYKLGESLINEQDMNWVLKAEEMAEAVFLHFQYKSVKTEWLEKENMYLGKHKSARYHFAITFASREIKTLDENLYERIIASLEEEKFKHLTIFTNVAVTVPPEVFDDRVLIKKIPAAILREYNLL